MINIDCVCKADQSLILAATNLLSAERSRKPGTGFTHGGERGLFNQLAYHWEVLDPERAMVYVGSLNGSADLTKRERLTAQILRACVSFPVNGTFEK